MDQLRRRVPDDVADGAGHLDGALELGPVLSMAMLRSSVPEATYRRAAFGRVVGPAPCPSAPASMAELGQRRQAGGIQERDPIGSVETATTGRLVDRHAGKRAVVDVTADRGRDVAVQPAAEDDLGRRPTPAGRSTASTSRPRSSARTWAVPGMSSMSAGAATTMSVPPGRRPGPPHPPAPSMPAARRCRRSRASSVPSASRMTRASSATSSRLGMPEAACGSRAARVSGRPTRVARSVVEGRGVERRRWRRRRPRGTARWASVSTVSAVAVVGRAATWVRSARS